MFNTALNSFHDESPYHIETSPLICFVNKWTGFYMIGTSVIKELITSAVKKPMLEISYRT